MADETPFWRDVWVQVTATLIAAALIALVTASHWSDVKPYLSGAWGWLSGNANITRGGLLALLLVLGGALWLLLKPRSALASERGRTRHPVPAPPNVADDAPAPVPARLNVADDAPAPALDVADGPDSMEGYFSGARALRGRFAEREEYLRRCRGKVVRWRGTVRSVGGIESDNSVVVHLLGESGQLTLTGVSYPATFRERVLALLPGDSVLVTGRFIKGDEDIVQIDGDGFELVKRANRSGV